MKDVRVIITDVAIPEDHARVVMRNPAIVTVNIHKDARLAKPLRL